MAEVVEPVGVADLFEALGAGRGTTAGEGGEGILETGPGAETAMFFVIHKALFASIDAERGGGSLQTGQLAAVTGIDRCRPAAFRRLFAPLPTLVWHGSVGGAGWEMAEIRRLGFVLLGIGKFETAVNEVGGQDGSKLTCQHEAEFPLAPQTECDSECTSLGFSPARFPPVEDIGGAKRLASC